MKGYVPAGAAEQSGQPLGQYVFAGGLGAQEQDVFAGQQGCGGLLPDLLSVVHIRRGRDAVPYTLGYVVLGAERADLVQDPGGNSFLCEKVEHG